MNGDTHTTPTASPHLARATVRGSAYTVAASGITISLGFLRAVLLARFLLPDHFGTVALAMVFVVLGNRLRALGLDRALLHKQALDGPYYGTYWTLKVLTVAVFTGLFILAAPLIAHFYPGQPLLAPVMIALALTTFFAGLNQSQETLLKMRLRFGALALTNVASAVAMLLVAPYLAWKGWGVWSLVAEQASGIAARGLLLWGPLRGARVTFAWDREAARWFWRYGRANWVGANVGLLLERFDDFWVGTVLGQTALGFYNRAYEFARYPRRLMANSLVSVMAPVFARLQGDRPRLSRAYFRLMSLLVRVGVLAGGVMVLLTPEFVFWLLGPRWHPLVLTFQLMLVYVLLDPLLIVSNNLLFSLGFPQVVARVRLAQLAFFVPAVIIAAWAWGINGVALAADGMLLVGLLLLHRPIRRHVDYSAWRMFAWPLLAGAGALALAVALTGWDALAAPRGVGTAALKAGVFTLTFGSILGLGEGREVLDTARTLRHLARGPRGEDHRQHRETNHDT